MYDTIQCKDESSWNIEIQFDSLHVIAFVLVAISSRARKLMTLEAYIAIKSIAQR